MLASGAVLARTASRRKVTTQISSQQIARAKLLLSIPHPRPAAEKASSSRGTLKKLVKDRMLERTRLADYLGCDCSRRNVNAPMYVLSLKMLNITAGICFEKACWVVMAVHASAWPLATTSVPGI